MRLELVLHLLAACLLAAMIARPPGARR